MTIVKKEKYVPSFIASKTAALPSQACPPPLFSRVL